MIRPNPRARRNIAASVHVPAPVAGLNTVAVASMLPDLAAPVLVNMTRDASGLRSRLGYKEHANGIGTEEVRSVLPFTGAESVDDALFAANAAGIWDVTAPGAATSKITFAANGARAGYGTSVVFTNGSGHHLIYTDEENGYYRRPEAGDWEKVAAGTEVGQINNVDPASFVQVCVWKGRLLFVEAGSARMWYLPVGALAGDATSFDFAREFRSGGALAGLYSWTMDGGAGMDDLLVAVSTAGDVVIYKGTDPDTPGYFGRVGGWFVGGVPLGRRLASTFGGELLLLTTTGLVPLSRLVAGRSLLSPDTAATFAIRNLVVSSMADRSNMAGWGVVEHPRDGTVLVTMPKLPGENDQQYAMNPAEASWSLYDGLPICSAAVWHGDLYFGDRAGKVYAAMGDVDNVTITNSAANQRPVTWGGITAFRNLGNLQSKRVSLIRPTFLSAADPTYRVEARYNFDLSAPPTALPKVVPAANSWDTAVWDDDAAVFDGSAGAKARITGARGFGTHFAVAWSGASSARTTLVGFDLTYDLGGFL